MKPKKKVINLFKIPEDAPILTSGGRTIIAGEQKPPRLKRGK